MKRLLNLELKIVHAKNSNIYARPISEQPILSKKHIEVHVIPLEETFSGKQEKCKYIDSIRIFIMQSFV